MILCVTPWRPVSCRGVLSWIVLCCAVPWRVMLRCVGLEGNALFGFALRCVENPWVDPQNTPYT